MLPFCFWTIWLTRNRNLFDNKIDSIPFNDALHQATEYELIIGQSTAQNHQKDTILVRWNPPEADRFMLNTDASVNLRANATGLGGIIRNEKGDWVLGFFSKEPLTSPALAELLALRQGLLMASQCNLTPLDINMDSLEVIDMFVTDNLLDSNLILECRLLMLKLEAAMSSHIFREQNRVADMLSKEGVKCTVFGLPTYFVTTPMFVSKSAWTDSIETPFTRRISISNVDRQGQTPNAFELDAPETNVP